ncbi:ribonuclease H-like domain-containing protein [Tanacetum coccineum]
MVKPVWNNSQRVNHQNFAKKTHPCVKKNLVPRAVLMKSGLVSVNTARQVNTAYSKTTMNIARPMSYLSKIAHSTVKRPIHKNTAFKNSNINQRVNTGNPQMDLRDKGVINSRCSRHMTENMSYLTNYEEIDGDMLLLEGTPKEGKSQEKLIDESQSLLRVPKKNNMYSVDLKNIVSKGGLTCLFAKVISDESKLWHRRLGHLNFKTMNKLVKGNLVRGLPYKLFENDQTCVACQKGKQHRATCTQSNGFADTKESDNADPKSSHDDRSKPSSDDEKKVDEDPRKDSEYNDQEKEDNVNSTNTVNVASTNKVNYVRSTVNVAGINEVNAVGDEDDGAKADMNNLDTTIQVSPNPTTRIHKDHLLDQVIGDLQSATQLHKPKKMSTENFEGDRHQAHEDAEYYDDTYHLDTLRERKKRCWIDDGGIDSVCLSPKTTAWNEFSSTMASAIICGGPRCQETMKDTIAQTRLENVSKHSNDLLLARGNTLQRDEDRLKLVEFMALCTTLQNRVLDLEQIKTTQHNEIENLKRRVKKLEKKNRIDDIDADEEITLVSVHDINVSAGEEFVEEVVKVINTAKLIIDVAKVSVDGDKVSTVGAATTISAATTTIATTIDDITLAPST